MRKALLYSFIIYRMNEDILIILQSLFITMNPTQSVHQM